MFNTLKKNLTLILILVVSTVVIISVFVIVKPYLNFGKGNDKTRNNETNNTSTAISSQSINTSTNSNLVSKSFTIGELKAFDGKDSGKCYIGYKNKVYEISDSRLWQNGVHTPSRSSVKCGQDNTIFMANAPHGEEQLDKFEVVGNLKN